jgi:CheY-like chemotaxis protein
MAHEPLKRILFVEDDPDVQTVVSLSLSGLGGFVVEVCGSAREALQAAPSFGPDLILLDVMMPGTDGIGAFHALREIPETAATPVVFITARARPDEVARYQALGSLGVITKPFDPGSLPKTLLELWDRRP